MEPLTQQQVKALDLKAVAEAEAAAWRNLLPPEPWTKGVAANPGLTAKWITRVLKSGFRGVPAVRVSARKASQGTRPVPILTVADRVVYRALTDQVLKDEDPLDRSPQAYRDFVAGPITAAFTTADGSPVHELSDLRFAYVVEADMASFYEYVDHAVLQREIALRSDATDLLPALMGLLGDVEAREFGVPQLLDSSDWLSDIYISIVERSLVRQGFELWRYNDDFRIGCRDYSHVMLALEALQDAGRAVGLVLSDHKTRSPGIITYIGMNTGRDVSDSLEEFDPDDVNVLGADYGDLDEEQQAEDAIDTLARLSLSEGDPRRIDLKRVRGDQARALRRALTTLGRFR